jgi:hypothetical protein
MMLNCPTTPFNDIMTVPSVATRIWCYFTLSSCSQDGEPGARPCAGRYRTRFIGTVAEAFVPAVKTKAVSFMEGSLAKKKNRQESGYQRTPAFVYATCQAALKHQARASEKYGHVLAVLQ